MFTRLWREHVFLPTRPNSPLIVRSNPACWGSVTGGNHCCDRRYVPSRYSSSSSASSSSSSSRTPAPNLPQMLDARPSKILKRCGVIPVRRIDRESLPELRGLPSTDGSYSAAGRLAARYSKCYASAHKLGCLVSLRQISLERKIPYPPSRRLRRLHQVLQRRPRRPIPFPSHYPYERRSL
jgi:hypothetical protein